MPERARGVVARASHRPPHLRLVLGEQFAAIKDVAELARLAGVHRVDNVVYLVDTEHDDALHRHLLRLRLLPMLMLEPELLCKHEPNEPVLTAQRLARLADDDRLTVETPVPSEVFLSERVAPLLDERTVLGVVEAADLLTVCVSKKEVTAELSVVRLFLPAEQVLGRFDGHDLVADAQHDLRLQVFDRSSLGDVDDFFGLLGDLRHGTVPC